MTPELLRQLARQLGIVGPDDTDAPAEPQPPTPETPRTDHRRFVVQPVADTPPAASRDPQSKFYVPEDIEPIEKAK